MNSSPEHTPLSAKQLDGYSSAALLALKSRLHYGNATTYDYFLCNYIGDPQYGSPHFRPLSRNVGGTVWHYNNPLNMCRSYSPEGTMVNIRWAQCITSPHQRIESMFVATADLRTDTTTEWRVTGVKHTGYHGRQLVTLEAGDYDHVSLASVPEPEADPLARVLARRQHLHTVMAQLVLSPDGNIFVPHIGPDEPLDQATVLVREVNELTAQYNLDLEARRWEAGQQLAKVIPLHSPHAA